MANFIVPNIQDIAIGDNGHYRNDIINIDLCKRIRISHYSGMGGGDLPSLNFVGCDYSWVFYTEKERDDCLAEILLIGNGQ